MVGGTVTRAGGFLESPYITVDELAAGGAINVSASVKPSTNMRLLLQVLHYDSPSTSLLTQINGTAVDIVGGVETRLSISGASPVNTKRIKVRIAVSSGGTAPTGSSTLDADELQITVGSRLWPLIVPGTDGATWNGATNASTSHREFVGYGLLQLDPTARTEKIPNGHIQAIGFYSPSNTGTVRISKIRPYARV